jgi:hypothetical protein
MLFSKKGDYMVGQENLLLSQLEAGQLASYRLRYLGHGRRYVLESYRDG